MDFEKGKLLSRNTPFNVLVLLEIAVMQSRPVRARGLKLRFLRLEQARRLLSRPVRARGLKHAVVRVVGAGRAVAPRAGAWIETTGCSSSGLSC